MSTNIVYPWNEAQMNRLHEMHEMLHRNYGETPKDFHDFMAKYVAPELGWPKTALISHPRLTIGVEPDGYAHT